MLGKGLGGLEKVSCLYADTLDSLGLLKLNIFRNSVIVREERASKNMRISLLPFLKLYYIGKILFALRKEKKILLIAHGRRAFIFSILLRRLMKLFGKDGKVILVIHSNGDLRYVSQTDYALCLTTIMYKEVEKVIGECRCFLLTNPVFPSTLYLANKNKSIVLRNDTIRIGIMSRLDNQTKSIDTALYSIDLIIKQYKINNIKLFIAGDGPDEAFLKQLVNKLNLSNYVEFCGWCGDSFWDKVDIAYVTSKIETFGLTLVDAVLHRKIVIASDILTFQEVVPMGIDYTFNVGEYKSLAERTMNIINGKIEKIRSDFDIYFDYIAKYSNENFAIKLSKILNKLLIN